MKRNLLLSAVLVMAGSLLAETSPKEEIQAAAKKLNEKGSYSWKSTTESAGGGGRLRAGPTEGKTDKSGFTHLTLVRGDTTTEAVLKGNSGAIKTPEGWQSIAELADAPGGGGGGGRQNPGRMMARTLQNHKAPADHVQELLAQTKELKKSGEAYTAELTEEGVRQLMSFGMRRPGAEGPAARNSKGNVKFWVKDGVLSKYEYRVQGTMSFNNNDVDVDRTTTVEIKDVGTTTVNVPDEAKKKIS